MSCATVTLRHATDGQARTWSVRSPVPRREGARALAATVSTPDRSAPALTTSTPQDPSRSQPSSCRAPPSAASRRCGRSPVPVGFTSRPPASSPRAPTATPSSRTSKSWLPPATVCRCCAPTVTSSGRSSSSSTPRDAPRRPPGHQEGLDLGARDQVGFDPGGEIHPAGQGVGSPPVSQRQDRPVSGSPGHARPARPRRRWRVAGRRRLRRRAARAVGDTRGPDPADRGRLRTS